MALAACSCARRDRVEVAVEHRADGSVAAKGEVFRGRKSGKWVYFHVDGWKEREVLYSEDAPWSRIRYHPNGEVADCGDLVDGQKDGVWRYYASSGDLTMVETYKACSLVKRLDLLEERVSYFYDNGQIRLVGTFRDGREDGDFVAYYDNGQKKEQGVYRDEKRDGVWVFWSERGDLLRREVWRDGVQVR